jgi:biotin transport system substrate-specific component
MTAAIPLARRPVVLSDLIPGSLRRDVALVVGGAALVGALAQLSFHVPGTPVPVTGQTFGVLLGGAALGWRRGLAAMLLYLVLGVLGVPWFAGHASGMVGASFGYLLACPVAAGVVGALAGRGGDRTPLRTILTMVVGTAIIYAIGVTWLGVDLHLSASQAFTEGMRPFLIGDAIKLLLAAGLLPGTWALLQRRQGRGRRPEPVTKL